MAETPQNAQEASSTPSSTVPQIPEYILDDLCSRFVINIPEEERQDLIRIFFQVELAHWFYLDFYCQENPELKAYGIREFSSQIFNHCPTLSDHASNVEKILESWREYKMAVPTYGAILLDPSMQYCLLVQGFWAKSSWGFPKGKVNEGEMEHLCACREVLEETGFDISHLLDQEQYLEFKIHEQLTRLYIVYNVSMETKFAPKTRKEIKNLQWFKIEYLPSHKKDFNCKAHYNLNPNCFFTVIPFIKSLRKWISRKQGKAESVDSEPNTPVGGRSAKSSKEKVKDTPQEPRVLTDKQRQKQKQHFSQQMQNEYQDYLGVKDNKTRLEDSRGKSESPPASLASKFQKSRSKTTSPKHQKRQYQILKRDGTLSGGMQPRRSLASQFADASQEKRSPRQKRTKGTGEFNSETWLNFKLDVESLLSCLP